MIHSHKRIELFFHEIGYQFLWRPGRETGCDVVANIHPFRGVDRSVNLSGSTNISGDIGCSPYASVRSTAVD